MATKKQPDLYLHCKCDSCKAWEIIYRADKGYFLKCATCNIEILIGFDLGEPHASLHWEK